MTVEENLIKKERLNATFVTEELTNILDGGSKCTAQRHKFEKLFKEDKHVKVPNVGNMTREERFVECVKRSTYFFKNFLTKNGWDYKSDGTFADRGDIAEYCFGLHFGAFTPCIYSFGSDVQVRKWAPLAENLSIIGAYAQTELGHGSSLRELETTVTYDKKTKEFIVNSPNITAAKWWPGDMGLLANHVILMSNLFLDGKNMGIHPFIVQIRDLSTHRPLAGVQVGDIGNKMAFETIDNGYLLMNNVRIPRENLLCKNAEVLEDGSYVRHASDRLMYSSMSRIRVVLIRQVIVARFAKAATIATRYSAVRCQGKINNKEQNEVCILDYQAQQYKILPQIAAVYALHFATNDLFDFYDNFMKECENGDLSNLPEMHVLSAGMKATSSEQAVGGCEVLRRACGGHGYSNASGLPRLYLSLVPSCTYEGENTVMYLQVARYLLKCASQIGSGVLKGSVAYLDENYDDVKLKRGNCMDMETLVRAYKKRSKEIIINVGKSFQDLMMQGKSMGESANMLQVQLINAAKAYVMQNIIASFSSHVTKLVCSDSLRQVIGHLFKLYALHNINLNQADFIKTNSLGKCCCDKLLTAETEILFLLRKNAVALVDAFDYTDDCLQSCIGCHDGEIYQRLFEDAKNSPLNKNDVHEESYKYIRPYLLKGRDLLERKSKL